MRPLVLALAATALIVAQPPTPDPLFRVFMGRLVAVSTDRIDVRGPAETHAFYSDAASSIWRGKDRHDFSALRVGDEVVVRYGLDPSSRAVVLNLWTNIDKVEGRITSVRRDGFQMDQNYSAPPDSGY